MEQIKFEDFTITPILSSLKRIDMTDEEYFSKKYRGYVSNSRLKLINPLEGGSPAIYKNPIHTSSQSLALGSAVHERLLQPESFELAPKIGKPNAKLGECIDAIIEYRKEGNSIYDSIVMASKKVNYYANSLTKSRIHTIIEKGLKYYLNSKKLKGNEIVLSDSDHDIVVECLKSVENNEEIMSKLHPSNVWEEIPSYNEDAIFIDFLITYKDRYTIIKYKMKIDNWTIDSESKELTLNDLKTTYKPVQWFMSPKYGSLYHYHYYRQFALYGDVLKLYCMKESGYNENEWKFNANVLVVSTTDPYDSKCYHISDFLLKKGRKEYQELLKRVAYYNIFGYDKEVEFI